MARDIGLDMAMVELARAAAESPIELGPDADEFPVAALPVDPEVWFGGIVTSTVLLLRGAEKKGEFFYWATGDKLLGIQPVLDGPGTGEAGYALWMTMLAPLFGEPRRPRRIVVSDQSMIDALNSEDYRDIGSIVEATVGPTDATDPLAQTALANARSPH